MVGMWLETQLLLPILQRHPKAMTLLLSLQKASDEICISKRMGNSSCCGLEKIEPSVMNDHSLSFIE